MLLPRARRRLILLPLSTSTHVSDPPCVIHFSLNGQICPNHRVPSSHVCRRMMCLKPLEVTRPSLAHRCTSPCNGSSHSGCLRNDGNYSAHSLYKDLWVKHKWWLAIDSWTTSTSPPSTYHLHTSNGKLRLHFSNPTSSAYATTNRPSHHELTRSSPLIQFNSISEILCSLCFSNP